jgi:hypothetical protein
MAFLERIDGSHRFRFIEGFHLFDKSDRSDTFDGFRDLNSLRSYITHHIDLTDWMALIDLIALRAMMSPPGPARIAE